MVAHLDLLHHCIDCRSLRLNLHVWTISLHYKKYAWYLFGSQLSAVCLMTWCKMYMPWPQKEEKRKSAVHFKCKDDFIYHYLSFISLPIGWKISEMIFSCLLQILGDQQAALVGQTCFKRGQAKNTWVFYYSMYLSCQGSSTCDCVSA